jgi:hypothetical protein
MIERLVMDSHNDRKTLGLRGMVTSVLTEDAAAEWLAHEHHQ